MRKISNRLASKRSQSVEGAPRSQPQRCAIIASWCFVSPGSLIVRRPAMDPQTVIALCELLLVVIGIVGIAELRRR
jgi:hypothetical protein